MNRRKITVLQSIDKQRSLVVVLNKLGDHLDGDKIGFSPLKTPEKELKSNKRKCEEEMPSQNCKSFENAKNVHNYIHVQIALRAPK